MAKMTKAAARKRLKEADEKIRKVYMFAPIGFLTPSEQNKLIEIHTKLVAIILKKM